MHTQSSRTSDEIPRDVENYLNQLGCGLRSIEGRYEVYNLADGQVIVTFADLRLFAWTNDFFSGGTQRHTS